MIIDSMQSIQIAGDREGWEKRLTVWDYELTGKPGCLRTLWESFVTPYTYGGPGSSFTNEPQLTRIRAGKLRGWVLEQTGGLDI